MINLVGLGPGDPNKMTLEAKEALDASDVIFFRGGKHHPVPKALVEQGRNVQFLGPLYHIGMRASDVYEVIAELIVKAAQRYPVTTYAVPGNIFVFETACGLIQRRAKDANVSIKLVPGLSSIESILPLLGADPSRGMAILEGGDVATLYSPRLATIVLQPWNKLDPKSVGRLAATLLQHLPPKHPVTIVSNATFRGNDHKRVEGTVEGLESLAKDIDPDWATLYVPAKPK
jgi:tetrapyrrole methylase family protein/MazG family protein